MSLFAIAVSLIALFFQIDIALSNGVIYESKIYPISSIITVDQTAPLYSIITRYLGEILNTKDIEFNSVAISCLRDDKNAAFVELHYAVEPGKRYNVRAQNA